MPEARVFPVVLTGADRDRLSRVVSAGAHPARMIMRARVLLALDGDDGSPAERGLVARQIGVSETTVRSVAERFVETDGDVEATITRKRRATPPVPSAVTGEVEARLIAFRRRDGLGGRCGCSRSGSR
jgi:hypothetical protein